MMLEGSDIVVVFPHHLFRQTDGFGEIVSKSAVFDLDVQLLGHPYLTPFLFMPVTARAVLQKRKTLYLTRRPTSFDTGTQGRGRSC